MSCAGALPGVLFIIAEHGNNPNIHQLIREKINVVCTYNGKLFNQEKE